MKLQGFVRKQHWPLMGITTRSEVHTDCKQHIIQGQMAEYEYAYEAGILLNELRY